MIGTPTKPLLAALLLPLLVGCAKEDVGETPPSVEDKIAAIRNNPNMPEASKKIAIGMLEKQKGAKAPTPDR